MTNKIVLIFFIIFSYEILFFFKIFNKINKNLKILKKIIKLFLLENLTDLRKEKLLVIYSKILLKGSAFIVFILLLILLLIFLIYYFFNSLFYFLVSFYGTLIILVLCVGYHYLRLWINAKLQ